MSREADYTIKGFVYQFNKTLEQLLTEPEGTEIIVEGIIEDIDVIAPEITKAIQCKYHETKRNYNPSDIAKPILQMLVHYSKNIDKNIQYILYAHFQNESLGEKTVSKTDIETILNTSNKKYIANFISILKPPDDTCIEQIISKPKKSREDLKKITDHYAKKTDLTLSFDIKKFLKTEKFKFIIGHSFEDLIENAKKLLQKNSIFSQDDINDLFYPNAIQIIAEKSINHIPEERVLEKRSFIEKLEETKKVAISRWTKELSLYKVLLKNRRTQLKINLQQNHRLRYFLFNSSNIENYDNEIVNFISDYLSKYHYKIKLHTQTPLFCIETSNTDLVPDVESRLYSKGISYENGYKGQKFFQKAFLKEPERIYNKNWFEFKLRLCQLGNDTLNAINNKKCDDIFIIGRIENKQIDLQDINIERLDVSNFNELRYLLLLKDNID